jgi:hypothetical protein
MPIIIVSFIDSVGVVTDQEFWSPEMSKEEESNDDSSGEEQSDDDESLLG